VCDAGLARRLTGSARPFTIRPEKIRLDAAETAQGDGASGATGTIDAVQYLGAATRYTVSLDGGGQLVALEQNVDDARPRGVPGQRVGLTWSRRHEQPLRGEADDSA
jgi:putative spermidine/putrescine transport system ATP-binding protein